MFRKDSDEDLAAKLGLPVHELLAKIAASRQKVFDARGVRVRPGLDNKILASWNGLMLKGLTDAYRTFNKPEYLELALNNAGFILNNLLGQNGRLSRVYGATSSQDKPVAFLDDYANIIDGLIALYEVTFNEHWLKEAKKLADTAIAHYYDEAKGIFFFTADDDEQLIARKSEIMDGVIPASNSVMARVLKKLGLLFDNESYIEVSAQLLRNVMPQLAKYGSAYSNWVMLLLDEVFGINEIAITGAGAETFRKEMENNYIPNKIMLGGNTGSLPLLQDKFGASTQIFICKDKTCGLPANNPADALNEVEARFYN